MRGETEARPGPLGGLTVIEMAGLGPVPLAGLMLAELGARVVRIERHRAAQDFLTIPPEYDIDRHGREILKIDLKAEDGRSLLSRLIVGADVLVEGFRPGVMERLGLGPDAMLLGNSRLVYARVTGFGQTGPLAQRAGHDLTYLALTGVLSAIGPAGGKPVPPLNLLADYAGGTMFALTGILAALVERGVTGRGKVVDVAMIDGASMLAAPYFGFLAASFWKEGRGSNLLDGGAPFYETYETADGGHVAVACLEPQFFAVFAQLLPLPEDLAAAQYDRAKWPAMRAAIAARFGQKTRDEWSAIFATTDACVAPVLSFAEAPLHPHNAARGAHSQVGELTRPTPAPRFDGAASAPASPPMRDAAATLAGFGVDDEETARLVGAGIVGR